MKVVNHRLMDDAGNAVPFRNSPNRGGQLSPRYLVMHFTAGSSAEESINWLCNPQAQASAHLLIARDGKITQLVAFDRVAWHAGPSRWEGLVGMNNHSIGIELDNAGPLERHGSKWRAWFGRDYSDNEVLVATHKLETREKGWHIFAPEQLEVAMEVALVLKQKYNLRDVIGHDDIATPVGRKVDPGPAFPMRSFQGRFLGRNEDAPVLMRTTASDGLNIRTDAGTQYPPVPGSPLPLGTQVETILRKGNWSLVDVLGTVNGVNDIEGWVFNSFLERV